MAAQLETRNHHGCVNAVETAAGADAQVRGATLPGKSLVSAIIGAAIGFYGMAAVAADAPKEGAPLKPDLTAGAATAEEICAACHAADGNSTIPANPKLAGQHTEYLVKQLKEFAPGEDGKPAARENAVMAAFAAQLSPQDMLNVSAFYASQKLQPAAASNAELVDLGRSIYRGGIAAKGVPACAACHGPAGDGMPAQYPALHGQFAEYTEAQLVAFRSGARGNNKQMTDIALRMTDAEIKAVSDYIAGLRSEKH